MSKEMIRYSRVNGRNPKNTLFTFREDNVIYFGISRCDLTSDHFERSKGATIAKLRATKAKEELAGNDSLVYNKLIYSDEYGLRGMVKIEDVKVLLDHFNSIDTFPFLGRR